MPKKPLLSVTLYGKPDCKLCDEVRDHLKSLEARFPHRLAEVNIESDPALLAKYGERIPVVEAGPYQLQAPITLQSLEMTLGAASDRRGQLQSVGGEAYQEKLRKAQTVGGADRLYIWIARHYLAILNAALFLYVGLPFLAPVLMKVDDKAAARLIYAVYSPLCHQFAFRSFFLFGEQPYYPLKEAGLTNVKTLDQVTGHTGFEDPYNVARLYAREFVGDPTIGYKIAICERDVAIYGALLLFGLIYSLTGRRIPPLHWVLWIVIGLGPIGLDGFSQMFSQFNWPWLMHILPYRESTPFLRVLTGGLFGFTTAWFAFPNIEESMSETRRFYAKKFALASAAD